MEAVSEHQVEAFWDAHPCGEAQVGGVSSDYESFFGKYDAFRYGPEGHILRRLDEVGFANQRVLEIGLGLGADSEQIIRRGGRWSGLDLTRASIERVRTRLTVRGLPFEALKQGTATAIPYADGHFDIVFSHGVLHHIPDIDAVQREVARVLKPGGRLIVMVYAKNSLNYRFSIAVARRAGLIGAFALGEASDGLIGQHVRNAREQGLWNYLRMENFIHRNTDGPLNPYSKVYDRRLLEHDFPNFRIERCFLDFMHAPPLPVGAMKALAPLMGWHLWAHMKKREDAP